MHDGIKKLKPDCLITSGANIQGKILFSDYCVFKTAHLFYITIFINKEGIGISFFGSLEKPSTAKQSTIHCLIILQKTFR